MRMKRIITLLLALILCVNIAANVPVAQAEESTGTVSDSSMLDVQNGDDDRSNGGDEDDKDAEPQEDSAADLEDAGQPQEEADETANIPAFSRSVTLEEGTVTVSAAAGVFPDDAVLSVTLVPVQEQSAVDVAVDAERPDGRNVALKYTFDIKILDAEGKELQPADEQEVQVSFAMAVMVANENLSTDVYHVKEAEDGKLTAEALDVETDAENGTATVTTDGFSYYSVEFTCGAKTYEKDGAEPIDVLEMMKEFGLAFDTTTVTDVSFTDPNTSDPEPFEVTKKYYYAYQDSDNRWFIDTSAPATNGGSINDRPYYTGTYKAWVTMNYGNNIEVICPIEFRYVANPIAQNNPGAIDGVTVGDSIYTFASGMPLSTVYIDNDHFVTPSSYEILADGFGIITVSPTAHGDSDFIGYTAGAGTLQPGGGQLFSRPPLFLHL